MKLTEAAGVHIKGLDIRVADDGIYMQCEYCLRMFIHDRNMALDHMAKEHPVG